jgi:hypothetical protein
MFDRMNDRQTAIVSILLAVVVAVLVWLVFVVSGVNPFVTMGGEEQEIGVIETVLSTVGAGLAAWGARIFVVRLGQSRWWPFVGTTALALSMLGPTYMADGISIFALSCLHFAAGIPLILGLAHVGQPVERAC